MFGRLVKAAFLIKNPEASDFRSSSPLPVLINPSDISVSTSYRTQEKSSTGEPDKDDAVKAEGGVKQVLKMLLHFDIVEQYNKMIAKEKRADLQKTATQILSVFGGAKEDLLKNGAEVLNVVLTGVKHTDFNVMSEKICCISMLQQATIDKEAVGFIWGSMLYAGIISEFSVKFTYFSNQGAPLRAEVNISMECSVASTADKEASLKAQQVKLNAEAQRPSP